jgi:hypothetical protein
MVIFGQTSPNDKPTDVRILFPDFDKVTYDYIAKNPNALLKQRLKKTVWNFSEGQQKNWNAYDFTDSSYYQVSSTCRKVGKYCYIFVEDNSWETRVDVSAVEAVANAFDNSTPANSSKGIYQTEVDIFGDPPDEDNDEKIIILILDIKDGYSPPQKREYTAGYFSPWNETTGDSSNQAEIFYMDCYPVNLKSDNGLLESLGTCAHEFQHMIQFNYHGIKIVNKQIIFLNEGCSLVASYINGYAMREDTSYATESNVPLFKWRDRDTTGKVLKDYSRAGKFMLYYYEQFGNQFLTKFVQNSDVGITAIDNALECLSTLTTRRFDDILPDWFLANLINEKTIDPKFGYNYSKITKMVTQDFTNSPNYATDIYGMGVTYLSCKNERNLTITFSSPSSNVYVKAIKKNNSVVNLPVNVPLNKQFSFTEFGEDYNELLFVIYNLPLSNDTTAVPITAVESPIALIYPNGNENIVAGTNEYIKWSNKNSISIIKIEYSTNNGSSWNSISENILAASGKYNWPVPTVSSNNCVIKISDTFNPTIHDVNDEKFSIISSFLILNSPDGNEVYSVGSTMNISWISASIIDNVKLELTTDNGVSWSIIISSIPASTGSFAWAWGVPNTPSSNCKIRISDASNLQNYDESDNVFSIITPPSLTLLSPNGGENWSVNSIEHIQWSGNNVNNVKLEYSTNGGSEWIVISASTAFSYYDYSWTIPNAPSANCKIRISAVSHPDVFDVSENVFTILAGNFWSSDPNANNPISIVIGRQTYPRITSDGCKGAIITWCDSRNSLTEIYAQRINSNGISQWTLNGIQISFTGGDFPELANVGDNSAVIIWMNVGIYAQKINSNGVRQWNSDGIAVSTASSMSHSLISDGSGGAIVTWVDRRDRYDPKIYAQKISSSGDLTWNSNGIAICTARDLQALPNIISDGEGGAIITWFDNRTGNSQYTIYNYDIYAQRISSTGEIQWTANGVPICTKSGNQQYPKIISDGNGGAIITWYDTNGGIYIQKIDHSGIVQWATDGIAVSSLSGTYPRITSDGNGGAIITWMGNGIFAQRVNSNGMIQWQSDGVEICNQSSDPQYPNIISDGNGGAIIAWKDWRNHCWDFFAQKINSQGVFQWQIGGTPICIGNGDKGYDEFDEAPKMVSDELQGAVITWTQNDYDVFASRIFNNGALPVELTTLTSTIEHGSVNLVWHTSTEVNNYGFDVERKSEAEDWLKIGFVIGNGNSNSPKNYSFEDENPPSGKIQYRLKQIDFDGKYKYSDVVEVNIDAPTLFALKQNYPNPFNPTTTIKYSIPASLNSSKGGANVKLSVYDVLGRAVVRLVDEEKLPGNYEVKFDGSNIPSGVYFYRIQAGSFSQTKKLILIK